MDPVPKPEAKPKPRPLPEAWLNIAVYIGVYRWLYYIGIYRGIQGLGLQDIAPRMEIHMKHDMEAIV